MTPKQEERIKNKIKKIKAALEPDKDIWGGFIDDGQGLRYIPPKLYIQLGDYSGGLHYLDWFDENFPDDSGDPEFLFEWTIILFKTGMLKEAEKKAFLTFTRNTYLFDKFFDRPIVPVDKWEGSNLEVAEYAMEDFEYSHNQKDLLGFGEWLNRLTQTEKFILSMNKYIEIQKQLKYENDRETRINLIKQAGLLEEYNDLLLVGKSPI